MVNSPLSREILESIQADMVCSGDEHDWCEIAHPTTGGNLTPEITLRTFNFAQGIQLPAFVMMTLFIPDLKPKIVYPVVSVEAGLPVSNEFAMGSAERLSEDTAFEYNECMLHASMTDDDLSPIWGIAGALAELDYCSTVPVDGCVETACQVLVCPGALAQQQHQ
jgi:hypothetical protein